MQLKVALKIGVNDRIMLPSIGHSRIDCLHTCVQAQDEISEIQTNAQSIGDCNLPPEAVEAELATRLLFVLPKRPHITCVDECRTVYLPKEMRTPFRIEVELHVAGLMDKVHAPVGTRETSWT